MARKLLAGIALALGVLSVTVRAQGGPFSSQLENFWRLIAAGGRTFTSISVSGGTITGVTLTSANPTFTGQWKVNGSLCAAGTVVQGGSPTTCTATPTVTTILVGDGTGSAPSITFSSDSAYGFYNVLDVPGTIGELAFVHNAFPIFLVAANIGSTAGAGQITLSPQNGVSAPSINFIVKGLTAASATGANTEQAAGAVAFDCSGTGITGCNIASPTVPITFFTGGTAAANRRWQIDNSGNLIGVTDNSYDIGASAATRPRSLYVGTNGTFGGTVNAAKFQVNGADFAVGTPCSNTGASSDISGTNTKTYFSVSCLIPANSLATAGDFVKLSMRGLYSGNATDTLTFTIEACQVQGCASGTKVTIATAAAITLTAVSNQAWWLDEQFVSYTTGASGTHDAQGHIFYELTGTTATPDALPNTTTTTWNDTVDEYITMSVTFSTTSGNNHASIRSVVGTIQ